MIEDPGDTMLLEREYVDRVDFIKENDSIMDKKVVIEPGRFTELKAGQIITLPQTP